MYTLNAENNFFEVRDDIDVSFTLAGDIGGNTGVFKTSDIDIGKRSVSHEINHSYGGERQKTRPPNKTILIQILLCLKRPLIILRKVVTQKNIDAIFRNVILMKQEKQM